MKGKIFFIGSYADSLINFRLQFMLEFVTRGYQVVALAPFDQKIAKQLNLLNIDFIPINIQRNGINPINDIKLFLDLKKIFSYEKPDVVFSYTIKPVVYASLAARSAKIKKSFSLMTGTGYVFSNQTLKSKLIGFIAKSLLKAALNTNTKVFFQNSDNLSFFIKNKLIGLDKSVIVVNGSGVDCNKFSPSPYPHELSFLMIGRLLSYKGVREYVQASRLLRKKYPYVHFRLVGWLDTNPESIKQEELDYWIKNGDIDYLGKLSDVRGSIENSSVYVLPSWNEGMPRTVLEAMAMARPIITTDTPGCKETVIPHHNGFLIPGRNVEALYEAMEYFILHPNKIKVMGEASRKIAVDKFDVHKINKDMLSGMEIT